MPSRRLQRTSLALLAGILLASAGGCRSERTSAGFRAEGLRSLDEPVYRNEPVYLRFNRTLDDQPPSRWAVSVRRPDGTDVAVGLEPAGRFLKVAPAAPSGWPPVPHLQVSLRWPPPGGGIHSADGASLSAGFEARVPLLQAHRRRPGALEFLGPVATASPGGAVGDGAEVTLRFNAPLDPATLEDGIVVLHGRSRAPVPGARRSLDAGDARLVTVSLMRPTPDPSVTYRSVGGRLRVHVTRALRSVDGRAPALEEDVTELRPQRATHGVIRIGFSEPEDLAPESRELWSEDGLLRPPRPTPHIQHVPRPIAMTDPWMDQPEILRDSPTRTHVLIDAAMLPDAGTRPFHVDEIWLFCSDDFSHSVDVLDFRSTLGYGPSRDFGSSFRLNRDRFHHRRAVSRHLRIDRRQDLGQVVRLRFEEPFYHEGLGLDLLLEIEHAGLESPLREPALRLQAFESGGSADRPTVVVGPAFDEYGRPSTVQPRMALLTHSYRETVTRWYLLPPLAKPVLSRVENHDFGGSGREGRDFRVYYQGEVLDARGRSTITGWDLVPPRGRVVKVRLKIEFVDDPRDALEPSPEIEHILLHFRDAADEQDGD